jgi:hypothetical protein
MVVKRRESKRDDDKRLERVMNVLENYIIYIKIICINTLTHIHAHSR